MIIFLNSAQKNKYSPFEFKPQKVITTVEGEYLKSSLFKNKISCWNSSRKPQKAYFNQSFFNNNIDMLFLRGRKWKVIKIWWIKLYFAWARLSFHPWIDGNQKLVFERIYPCRMDHFENLFLDVYFDGSNFLKRECSQLHVSY